MKGKKVEPGVTYVGVVEDNLDPDKQGRLKIRVVDIYDEANTEDIPWASPWKDLGGGQISIPEKGKVVIVVFEQGDPYKPEYISTEHWNVNLENKLKSLSDGDYLSMKSILFDHKTQIYSNDSEGLKLDHKFNNINIKTNGINLNLKDNSGLVNIGDSTANQQAILGNHFLDWFSKFVDSLLNNTAFLGNAGAPVISNPEMIRILSEFKAQKTSTFLSHHVNLVDNSKVSSVKLDNREEVSQLGDTWQSTRSENTLTTNTNETNKPTEGEKPPYDEKHVEPSTETPGVEPTIQPPAKPIEALPSKSLPQSNKKVEKIIWFLRNKNYQIYEAKFQLNIVAFRNKKQVRDEENTNVTNLFDEELCVFYKNDNDIWELFEYNITTVPGFIPAKQELPKNVGILVLGQYVERLKMISYLGNDNYKALSFDNCSIHRNDKLDRYNFEAPIETGNFAMTIHRSSDSNTSEFIFNYSEGAQVFKNFNQYEQFIKICQNQIDKGGKSTFTYTLCSKSEYDEYPSPDEQRELVRSINTVTPPLVATQSIPVSATQSLLNQDYKSEMMSLISRRFVTEPGKPSIKSFIDRFTKDNSNSFETKKIISFGEMVTKSELDYILKNQGDSIDKVINNNFYRIVKEKLKRHINYLIKNGKIKKSDYFKGDLEKGIFITRVSFKEAPDKKKPQNQYIASNIVSESAFISLLKTYTNITTGDNSNIFKPSKNNSWVLEPNTTTTSNTVLFVEVKFVPFSK